MALPAESLEKRRRISADNAIQDLECAKQELEKGLLVANMLYCDMCVCIYIDGILTYIYKHVNIYIYTYIYA